MTGDLKSGFLELSMRRKFGGLRNIEWVNWNAEKIKAESLDRYVEAGLEPYKRDWEKNRAEYAPSPRDFPGSLPD